jgi:hypothetical protein
LHTVKTNCARLKIDALDLEEYKSDSEIYKLDLTFAPQNGQKSVRSAASPILFDGQFLRSIFTFDLSSRAGGGGEFYRESALQKISVRAVKCHFIFAESYSRPGAFGGLCH